MRITRKFGLRSATSNLEPEEALYWQTLCGIEDLDPNNFVVCRGIKHHAFVNLDSAVWLFPREANVGDIVFCVILDPHGPASGVLLSKDTQIKQCSPISPLCIEL